jgi:peptidoglycan hydrolase-like protein with peptidoglycan-binding domain
MKNGLRTYGVDGSFGQATENAVKNYQKANGLTQDGVVGEKTWNSLLK